MYVHISKHIEIVKSTGREYNFGPKKCLELLILVRYKNKEVYLKEIWEYINCDVFGKD